MALSGLHLLLTYACTLECDHCFVWSSPRQPGTFTIERLEQVLEQGQALGSIEWIYYEGGEPFLHYAILRWGVHRAAQMGFRVGIVTNAYWAEDRAAAREALRDLAGFVDDLSVSCDLHHGDGLQEQRARHARAAAQEAGIPCGVIAIAAPEAADATKRRGVLPAGESILMYRGRAADRLAARGPSVPARTLTSCPYEDLRDPGRVHVDPLGYVHLCQGITLGNVFVMPLDEILARYEPERHPVAGALIEGGPLRLATRFGQPHAESYADACHFCYDLRRRLRAHAPEVLAPDQMYGEVSQA